MSENEDRIRAYVREQQWDELSKFVIKNNISGQDIDELCILKFGEISVNLLEISVIYRQKNYLIFCSARK